MEQSIVQKIINEIEHYTPKAGVEHVGRVTSVGDGVVAIDGLSRAVMGEIIQFEEIKLDPMMGKRIVQCFQFFIIFKR